MTNTFRKETKSKISRTVSELKKLEERLAQFKAEKDSILQYFAENPTAFSKEKSARLAELNSLLEKEEGDWLALSSETEALNQNLK